MNRTDWPIIAQAARVVSAFDRFERTRTSKGGWPHAEALMLEIRKLRRLLRTEPNRVTPRR